MLVGNFQLAVMQIFQGALNGISAVGSFFAQSAAAAIAAAAANTAFATNVAIASILFAGGSAAILGAAGAAVVHHRSLEEQAAIAIAQQQRAATTHAQTVAKLRRNKMTPANGSLYLGQFVQRRTLEIASSICRTTRMADMLLAPATE